MQRIIYCCCRISSRSMERHSFGKLCGLTRKIHDTAQSRREASSSAFPISSPTSGMRQGCHEWNGNQDFFRYTAGRFLFDEIKQMACRYVRFDMNELVHIAVSSIASRSCVAVRKLPEGQYSKAFLLTMDDGKRVIAKVPNPNAGRPHYTTASEVATMDFVSIISPYNIKVLPCPQDQDRSPTTYTRSVRMEFESCRKLSRGRIHYNGRS